MKKTVSIIIALLLLICSISSYAADEKEMLLASDKTEITKGEEVEITISSNELTGIEGTLEFEADDWTLEEKTSNNSFTLNEVTGKFALANISGEEKISVKLTLKSKENTAATSSTIKVTGIAASDKSGQGYEISDKSVTIKFKTDEIVEPTNSTKETVNEYVQINSVSSEEKQIPYTGEENIFISITVLMVVSFGLYIGYKKNNF